jgi:NADH:ubiquinone oxidoreductase subunit 6 (subunit J)
VIQVVFLVFAALGLVSALGTILARNLVRAAICLIGFFATIAAMFVLMEAEFLAALQVLVYIGAVAIILMFGIMLTRNIQGDDPTSTAPVWKLPGLVAGALVFSVLAYGINSQKGLGTQYAWNALEERPKLDAVKGEGGSPRTRAVNNMGAVVGQELMTRYVIAFEVAGLLLTAALVGAIAIAHREDTEPLGPRGPRRGSQETAEPAPGPGAAFPVSGARPVATAAPGAPVPH